jgi:FkbM family methyltransferase
MRILDNIIDLASESIPFSKVILHAANRIGGLQYGSYTITDEVALARSFVKLSGGAIIDAGANRGSWSKLFISDNFAFDKLIVIEPQGIHFDSLQALRQNSSKIIIEKLAVGSSSGEVTLYTDKDGSSHASLYERNLAHVGTTMQARGFVELTTLDSLAAKHCIHHVAFLKLDLEGHELEALKGANELLSRRAIDAIAFEFGGCNIDSRTYIKDFWSLMVARHGFSLYRLLPRRRLRRLPKYSESLEQFSWQNILACAPGIVLTWDH